MHVMVVTGTPVRVRYDRAEHACLHLLLDTERAREKGGTTRNAMRYSGGCEKRLLHPGINAPRRISELVVFL